MKKNVSILLLLILVNLTACAQKNEVMNNSNSKSLVVYFSATGTTEKVAKKLATIAGADLFKINPQKTYSSADLNWHDKQSRSSVEMNDPKARPMMLENVSNMTDYEVVYIGFPIWWYEAPRIINTFIENNNLEGKELYVFATSGGSTIDNSWEQLKKNYPNLLWKDAKLLNHASETLLKEWVK